MGPRGTKWAQGVPLYFPLLALRGVSHFNSAGCRPLLPTSGNRPCVDPVRCSWGLASIFEVYRCFCRAAEDILYRTTAGCTGLQCRLGFRIQLHPEGHPIGSLKGSRGVYMGGPTWGPWAHLGPLGVPWGPRKPSAPAGRSSQGRIFSSDVVLVHDFL